MAAIERHRGDLLQANADALVNTVNTVGVMGKGVALQFRRAFPDNYEAYRRACEAGEVRPGKMHVFETGRLVAPRLIINFPTKRHWKGKSRMEDIEAGLVDLARVLVEHQVQSVAIPPLGCGNGGLRWSTVKPRIEEALGPVPGLRVLLYGPDGAPPPLEQTVRTPAPRMTRERAALLTTLQVYRTDPGASLTLLVAQKLAYFLQTAGVPLKLHFSKEQYGPYAENLNHALQRMDGHFIRGYGDRTQRRVDLSLDQDAVLRAKTLLTRHAETAERAARVQRLIDGFESPFGLELLATVHWAAQRTGTPQGALDFVADWTPRKREFFQQRHVDTAWKRLEVEGWLANV